MAKDFSQEQLAERMGVDRAYISGLEAGQRNPTIITVWHTAEALGVKMPDLFEPGQTHQKPLSRKRAPRRIKP